MVLPQVVAEVVKVLELAVTLYTDGLVVGHTLDVTHELLDGRVGEVTLTTAEHLISAAPAPAPAPVILHHRSQDQPGLTLTVVTSL